MREGIWRWLIPLAVAMHGLGMIGGVYFVFTARSAILGGNAVARALVAAMWVISGVALLWAAWAFYQGSDAWRTPGLVGATLSLFGIALWAGSIPPGTYVGAVLDVAIIAYALMTRGR